MFSVLRIWRFGQTLSQVSKCLSYTTALYCIIPYKASSEEWTIVGNRKTSRPSKIKQVQPNNLQEFPPLHNKYTTLQVDGDDPQVPLATGSLIPSKTDVVQRTER